MFFVILLMIYEVNGYVFELVVIKIDREIKIF